MVDGPQLTTQILTLVSEQSEGLDVAVVISALMSTVVGVLKEQVPAEYRKDYWEAVTMAALAHLSESMFDEALREAGLDGQEVFGDRL